MNTARVISSLVVAFSLAGCESTYTQKPNYVHLVSTNEHLRSGGYKSPLGWYKPLSSSIIDGNFVLENGVMDEGKDGNYRIPGKNFIPLKTKIRIIEDSCKNFVSSKDKKNSEPAKFLSLEEITDDEECEGGVCRIPGTPANK